MLVEMHVLSLLTIGSMIAVWVNAIQTVDYTTHDHI